MNWLAEYWYVLLMAAVIVVAVVLYFRETKSVKEWLLYAVVEAEKALGGGTGRVKLRQVYDLFIQRFPTMSKLVPFDVFSQWVDEVLVQLKKLLESNADLSLYIAGLEVKQ